MMGNYSNAKDIYVLEKLTELSKVQVLPRIRSHIRTPNPEDRAEANRKSRIRKFKQFLSCIIVENMRFLENIMAVLGDLMRAQ